jgi:UDP-N-acetylmuramate--alanine ligase
VLKNYTRIHFIGIGGSGMSGLAEIALSQGLQVTGSDNKETVITNRLANLGAQVFHNHCFENLSDAQVVVISSAISKKNPELVHALNSKIPVIHRSEFLGELMHAKTSIVVAGTHGKTTTTSLLAAALCGLKLNPTVVVGGKLNTEGSNSILGQSAYFLAEADESDGSFLRLSPTISVLTNIDKDHLDHYHNFDNLVAAFADFASRTRINGYLCACIDDEHISKILEKYTKKVITFGLSSSAQISATDIHFSQFESVFTPVILGKKLTPLRLKMPGTYNIINSLASYAVAMALGLDFELVSKSLETFEGVLHRFTKIGSVGNITVVDDYAHNPTKIKTLLRGIRESFANTKVIAVFQPHRYSRVQTCFNEFSEAFVDADELIVAPVYAAGEKSIQNITHVTLAESISKVSFANRQKDVFIGDSLDHCADMAKQAAVRLSYGGTVLLVTMGAGDISGVGQKIFLNLQEECGP